MNRIIKGKQSLLFENAPYIVSAASVTGSKEAEGPLGKLFDMTNEDDLFGAQTWEEAESTMQKEACVLALGKAHVKADEIRYLFGGDLLRQGIATSMGVEALQIPMFGLYGACSTSGEALALAGMSAAAGYGKYMLAVTSSHFGSAEKEFRFPLGYANQRPLSAHWAEHFLYAQQNRTVIRKTVKADVKKQHFRRKTTSVPLISPMYASQELRSERLLITA